MARLLIHVEGQTEESFVNEVLRNHLVNVGYQSVSARIVGNARLRQRRGGIRPWPSVRKDIINHLREDPGCIATTMVDFYALPQHGDGAWPGRATALGTGAGLKAVHVESALAEDLSSEVGSSLNPKRFMPFVVMHEFEGLLFSDCLAFCQGIGRPDLELQFQQIRNDFETPEDINDSPITCPSKRVKNLVPGYEKPLYGTFAALEVGLPRIRTQCPHFDGWLRQLESHVNLPV
jgi:hypothetical protein